MTNTTPLYGDHLSDGSSIVDVTPSPPPPFAQRRSSPHTADLIPTVDRDDDWEEPITKDDVMEHILQYLFGENEFRGPIGDALSHDGWHEPFLFAVLDPDDLRTRFSETGEVFEQVPLCARDINALKSLLRYHDILLDEQQVV